MPDALPNPSASTISTARPEVDGGSPIRVLIVDDYAPVRRGIRLLLSSVAHVSICGEAADGIEAIEKAAELRPDLVLMDITMPRKDGLQATLAIKQALPGTRVILVSQNDPGLVQLQAAETNADGCVVKSELWQQLIPAIGNCFSKPSLEPGLRKTSRTAPPRPTASRQAEEATGLLAAIVASSDDAIVSKDLNGIITSWNKSAERLFGYTAQEAIGRQITLIIPHNRLNEEDEILSRIRRGERVDHFETIRVRKDGTTIELSLTISPILDQDGRVIGASKVARDISESKRAEQHCTSARSASGR
jgi:PAS domain S-box-containing protein